MQHREIGKTNFIIIIFFLDAILIYSSSPRSRGRFDLREDRPPVKDRKKRRRRRDVGAQQRRLRHWILARRKISVLRINVSHKTNFWLTLEGIGEVVKKKGRRKKARFAGARHLDASTRRTEVSCFAFFQGRDSESIS